MAPHSQTGTQSDSLSSSPHTSNASTPVVLAACSKTLVLSHLFVSRQIGRSPRAEKRTRLLYVGVCGENVALLSYRLAPGEEEEQRKSNGSEECERARWREGSGWGYSRGEGSGWGYTSRGGLREGAHQLRRGSGWGYTGSGGAQGGGTSAQEGLRVGGTPARAVRCTQEFQIQLESTADLGTLRCTTSPPPPHGDQIPCPRARSRDAGLDQVPLGVSAHFAQTPHYQRRDETRLTQCEPGSRSKENISKDER